MKILALSDKVVEHVYSQRVREQYHDIDLILGCGDLPFYYLEFVLSMLDKPALYVHGNHDAGIQYTSDGRRLTGADGAESIEDRIVEMGGLLFMGLGGSMRYQSNAKHQYSEGEMRARVRHLLPKLLFNKIRYKRFVDVIVAHSAPYQIHDKTDRAHIGFRTFLTLMSRFKPHYLLHGHSHVWRQNTVMRTPYKGTTVINVYPVSIIEVDTEEGLYERR